MPTKNRRILLASRPSGTPTADNFTLTEAPIPALAAGQVLVRAIYLSVDPYMRGRMNDAESYADPVALGAVMTGGVVGEVIDSRTAALAVGDIVEGQLGWQEYAIATPAELRKVDPALAPISTALGVLGMPGMTAYFGLLDIGRPQVGETVAISGAAGAVGSLAGQIAKLKVCCVVGSAGSEAKVVWLTGRLGFDGAFNYKADRDYHGHWQALCPGGIDIYFDNVGGAITDAAVWLLRQRARIVVCGQISLYNTDRPQRGPRWLMQLIVKRALVQGFIVHDYAAHFPAAMREMADWLLAGKLVAEETVIDGLENAPKAFLGLFEGENLGKQLVQVSTP